MPTNLVRKSIFSNLNTAINKTSRNKLIIIVIIAAILIIAGVYFSKKNPVSPIEKLPEENKELLDSDYDGLPDEIEKIIGTDLNNWDTDSDSFSDSVEIKNGYNPITAGENGKYSQEEIAAIKEKIKKQNAEFYDIFFSPASGRSEDFSTPEAALKIFYSAAINKNRELFLETLNKESLNVLEARFVNKLTFSQMTRGLYLDAMIQEKYSLIEQNGRFAIMAPSQRKIMNAKEKIPGSEFIIDQRQNIYFKNEDEGWKIDTEASIADGTMRNTTKEPALKEQLNFLRDYWMSGGKADTASKP